MQYCKNCVYPIAAVNLQVDEEGVCSSCRTFDKFSNYSDEKWEERRQRLANVLEKVKEDAGGTNYDCLIPVSGGKDSYYQTHVICFQLGLKWVRISMY